MEMRNLPLPPQHLVFHQSLPEGIFGADMTDASVYVDTTLTADIEAEGYCREIIRRLQEMRKQLELNVDDMIVIDAIITDTHLRTLLSEPWQKLIKEEVRAKTIMIHDGIHRRDGSALFQLDREWEIEGICVTLGISLAE
jgi:isoleucyl-tRNA synthetase